MPPRKTTTKKKAPVKKVTRKRNPMPMMTAAQVVAEIAETTGIPKTDVRHVLDVYQSLAMDEVAQGHKFKLANLVQLQPRVKAATKKRMGRNPRTGEAVPVPAKPASVVIGMRRLTALKDSAPTMPKLKKVLGG